MRRNDREVTEIKEIENIIKQCRTCHVAMVDRGEPYIVPLSFGYELAGNRLVLYFHSAAEGRKLDILRENNKVCFEMCCEGEAIETKNPCGFGYYYASVIGRGEVIFIDKASEGCKALSLLMKHQAGWDAEFSEGQIGGICIYKIVCSEFTGKRRK